MITVKIGETTFVCSTASEAVLVHRLATGQSTSTNSAAATSAETTKRGINGTGPGPEFLKKLQSANGKELDAVAMAKHLGVNSPNGVGPRLASIRKSLEAQTPPVLLDDFLFARKGPKGTVWTINFDQTSKSQ